MRILYVHSLMFHHRTWQRVVERLEADGIDLQFAVQTTAAGSIENLTDAVDLLIADLAVGLPGYDAFLEAGRRVARRIGLSPEMPADFTTFSSETAVEFRHYVARVSLTNFVNGILFLAHRPVRVALLHSPKRWPPPASIIPGPRNPLPT
ncbi:MAG: hypothetical protein SWC96_12665 [Thermodesulfobacteriota bacterium]|nr:hypothetical protein [Thermodesulfobacteriota bacterium]